MRNLVWLLAVVSVVCCFSVSEAAAQRKSSKAGSAKKTTSKSKSSSKKSSQKKSGSSKKTSRMRLPKYFTYLKLTDEQKDEVDQIQVDFTKQIEGLNEQVEKMKKEQQDALEDVLTRTQKTLYNKYVSGTMRAGGGATKSSSKTTSRKSNSRSKTKSRKKQKPE